jgi:RNA polymerase sigma-70 factor, ECF subfamily
MALDPGEVPNGVLVAKAAEGDRAAFAALVERHYGFVYRVAYRWCGRRADAEDIAQEVCVRLGRSIRSLRAYDAFATWLYALTLNAARDIARKQVRERAKAEAFHAHALSADVPEPSAEDKAEALWAAVRQLPDRQREAVLLVYGEGMSHAAASDVLGSAEATVSWHIHEAKKRLRRMMRAAGEV